MSLVPFSYRPLWYYMPIYPVNYLSLIYPASYHPVFYCSTPPEPICCPTVEERLIFYGYPTATYQSTYNPGNYFIWPPEYY